MDNINLHSVLAGFAVSSSISDHNKFQLLDQISRSPSVIYSPICI